MDSLRLRVPLTILGLAILFYFLSSISMERMPFALLPSWWMGMWASHRWGVYTWFGLLNVTGAVLAAIPIAILLRLLIERNRVRAAFIVGVITALVVTGSGIREYSPFSGPAIALMDLELFLAFVLAVPLLIWLLRALPRNERIAESRQS
jgi:hypothetical protein